MKLWIKDAPVYGVNTNEEVLSFIEKHITCKIPDPISNPHLFYLVNRYQFHKCCLSCKRVLKSKKYYCVKCRYGFPRSVCNEASLNSLETTINSRKKGNLVSSLGHFYLCFLNV